MVRILGDPQTAVMRDARRKGARVDFRGTCKSQAQASLAEIDPGPFSSAVRFTAATCS